jgi:hypothetical protein
MTTGASGHAQYGDVVRIGVAMSGGGHRATVWGAGTLLAVSDAGLARDVTSVSSVSGGSITNGVVAHDLDLTSSTPADVETSLRRLMRQITGVGLFWFGAPTDGWLVRFLAAAVLAAGSVLGLLVACLLAGREVSPWWFLLLGLLGLVAGLALQGRLSAMGMPANLRRLVVVLLALIGVPVAVLTAITTWAHGWWLVIAVIVATVLAMLAVLAFLWVFSGRGEVVARGLEQAHFNGRDRPALLRDVDRPSVHHVFCATDLQSGDSLYLTPRMVSGYRVGFGTPGDLPLAVAVQCSACLPGAFPPRTLYNKANTAFNLSRTYDTDRPGFPDQPIERLVVNDGGVYDNMADQWEQGYRERAERNGSPLDADGRAELLIIVNAGKSAGWSPWKGGRMMSDLPGLTRTIDTLYDVSTSHRRKRFVSTADAAGSGTGGRGTLVHITTSPLAVVGRFAHHGDDDQKARAEVARAALLTLADEAGWARIADANGGVKTTLGRLSVDDASRLLWHSYVLTWISVWIVHGLGAPPDPARLTRDRFVTLCQPALVP